MKAAEKRRRIEASRPNLIAQISAMRLREVPGAEHLLVQANDPRISFTTFQALHRVLANKRKHGEHEPVVPDASTKSLRRGAITYLK